MAEVVVLVCDACAKRNQHNRATETIRVVIDGEPLRVDVCEEHNGEFRRVLDVLKIVGWQDQTLASVSSLPSGRRGAKSKPELLRSPGAAGCPICFKLMSTPGNMNGHMKKMHLRKAEEFTREEREAATREARKRLAEELPAAEGEE